MIFIFSVGLFFFYLFLHVVQIHVPGKRKIIGYVEEVHAKCVLQYIKYVFYNGKITNILYSSFLFLIYVLYIFVFCFIDCLRDDKGDKIVIKYFVSV